MEQRSQEWFAARRGRLTGSNVGAALGLSPWKKPEDLIRQMAREYHGAEPDFVGNVATEYGQQHEALAMMDYLGKTGLQTHECGFFEYQDWLGASPDGLVFYGDEAGVIEIKCPYGQRNKKPTDFKPAEDQPHYYAQMQIEMLCADVTFCDFYQWSQHGDSLERVHINESWLDENLPRLKAFHGWYLSELDNPEHLEEKEKEINTFHAQKLIQEWDQNKAAIDDATARNKEILAELVQLSKERNAIIHGRKLTMVERVGNVQYKNIPELQGVDLDQYRGKPSVFWKLS